VVKFHPAHKGARSATFKIARNGTTNRTTVAVVGKGV